MGNFTRNDPTNIYGEAMSHIPDLSFWLIILRGFQFLLGFIILILTAFASTQFPSFLFPGYGMSWFTFIWTLLCSFYVIITRRSLSKLYNYWAHLALEITLVIFHLTTFSLLASEIPLWNTVDNKLHSKVPDKTLVSAARASKAAVGLSFILFLTMIVSTGLLGHAISTHRSSRSSPGTSSHARQTPNSILSHHYNSTPNIVHPLARPKIPASPRPLFSRTSKEGQRPISLPVLQKRPEIGETYRMRGTYENHLSTRDKYRNRNGEGRMQNQGYAADWKSEEDDGWRTDFSPAFV